MLVVSGHAGTRRLCGECGHAPRPRHAGRVNAHRRRDDEPDVRRNRRRRQRLRAAPLRIALVRRRRLPAAPASRNRLVAHPRRPALDRRPAPRRALVRRRAVHLERRRSGTTARSSTPNPASSTSAASNTSRASPPTARGACTSTSPTQARSSPSRRSASHWSPNTSSARSPPDRLRFSTFGEHPVGTGPYMLQRWQHDSEVVFVRNPYAWRRPQIARLDYRIIFNDQSEMEALANGSADLIDDLSLTQYQQLQRIAPHVKLLVFPSDLHRRGRGQPHAARPLRCRRAPGDDVRLRPQSDGRRPLRRQSLTPRRPDPGGPNALVQSATSTRIRTTRPKRARCSTPPAGHPAPTASAAKARRKLSFELLLNQGSSLLTDEMLLFVADMEGDRHQPEFAPTRFRLDGRARVHRKIRPGGRRLRRRGRSRPHHEPLHRPRSRRTAPTPTHSTMPIVDR